VLSLTGDVFNLIHTEETDK